MGSSLRVGIFGGLRAKDAPNGACALPVSTTLLSVSAKHVYVYIDETGDRGAGDTASPIFGMAAILVEQPNATRLRAAVDQLRTDFGVKDGTVMSWKKHVKTHDRRRRAAELLSAQDYLKVCYVYADKSRLIDGSYRDDPKRFYDFVAYRTFKSAVWAARNLYGSDARVHIRYGHVRHHTPEPTKKHIQHEAHFDPKVPHQMVESLQWVSADRFRESEAADLFGGFLSAAIWPQGQFDYTESAYLLTAWPRIRNSDACAIPLGIHPMPSHDVITDADWFPCDECIRHSRTSGGRST